MPYSSGCTTPLSNFEVGLDYRDVNDPAVTVSFPLVDDPSTSLLAWTTTPWTLPSNLALCVHPEFTYIKIRDKEKDTNYILCDKLLGTLYKDPKKANFEKIATFKGVDLKGWRYVPLFEYFTEEVRMSSLALQENLTLMFCSQVRGPCIFRRHWYLRHRSRRYRDRSSSTGVW